MYRLVYYRGSWCVYWREGQKAVRRSLGVESREQAEREFRDFVKRANTPTDTVEEIFEAYLAEKGDSAKWNWKALKPFFGHYRPDQITRKACKEYIKLRSKDVKANTIHRELTMLRAAVRWHNPQNQAVFELPTRPAPKDRYLTKDEAKQLIEGAHAPHVKLFIILALTTAGRATAILELKWSQVDLEKGTINLKNGRESKTKGRAHVPINQFSRKALEEAQKAALTDYVIEWAGEPLKDIKKGVWRAAERAGLEDVSPHVLRHSAAVWMAEAGTPMSEIAQYLGHSSTSVTERVYARYSPEYLRTAAKALDLT